MWQSKGHKTETVKGNSDLIRYSNTQNFTSERVQLSKPQPRQEIYIFFFCNTQRANTENVSGANK